MKSEIEEALGRGGTSASFQAIGTLHSRKEQCKMSAMGTAGISAYVFRTQFGKSSGPPAREFLMTWCPGDHVLIYRNRLVVVSCIHTYTVGQEHVVLLNSVPVERFGIAYVYVRHERQK